MNLNEQLNALDNKIGEEVHEKMEPLPEIKQIAPSIEEPPSLELKPLPEHLEYALLREDSKLPVIINENLTIEQKSALIQLLRKHVKAIAMKITDIQGINPYFCTHKINIEDTSKLMIQPQHCLNQNMVEVVKTKIIKIHDAGIIYPISDSTRVSPTQVVPKKGGMTVVPNDNNELIPTQTVTRWRVCIDYHRLNEVTIKDHFPLPFLDQVLEQLVGHDYYCFLDGMCNYFQIPVSPEDQEKTTLACPFGRFAYMRIPFGLYNTSETFQHCMIAIFDKLVGEMMEFFMDDFFYV
ncbi:unnamed protein product [Linum trigynum]|uniref:Reverse transcriptase domain-containing protein n=1 Tax=Linum trigynum TaxID=586398 RepID=A0AAV2D9C0_9ROSI